MATPEDESSQSSTPDKGEYFFYPDEENKGLGETQAIGRIEEREALEVPPAEMTLAALEDYRMAPTSPDFTMGGIVKELYRYTSQLLAANPTPEQAVQALNVIHSLKYTVSVGKDMAVDFDGRVEALTKRAYGDESPEPVRTEEEVHHRTQELDWHGAPIQLELGGNWKKIALERDGKGVWYTRNGSTTHEDPKPIDGSVSIGRSDFEHERNKGGKALVSREHLVLKVTRDGKIELHDISTNGTVVVHDEYPQPVEAQPQEAETKQKGLLASLRDRVRRA
jgi:hypothetical protein